MNNKELVRNYIETVWNGRDLTAIEKFMADHYTDFSFIPGVPTDKAGLRMWIENTSKAFEHHTSIDSIIEENDEVALRISFRAKHVGTWRGIAPTLREVTIKGFRYFKLINGKIVAHWALIDGEALQTALTDQHVGCELRSAQV